MAEGIIDDTIGEARQHPWLIGGIVVAVVVLVYFLGSKPATPTAANNFRFSYGPSDAQVVAGTQLAIAQSGQQTALSVATLGASNQQALATTQAGIDTSYFNYLTTAGQTNANAATSIAATNANYAYQTVSSNNATALAAKTLDTNYAYQTISSNNATALAAKTLDANNTTLALNQGYALSQTQQTATNTLASWNAVQNANLANWTATTTAAQTATNAQDAFNLQANVQYWQATKDSQNFSIQQQMIAAGYH
jgi:hypothetical protein